MKKALFLLLLLGGCRTYQPDLPSPEIPAAWKETSLQETTAFLKNRFWELFEDPVLNHLEEEAIQANFDLQIAASRIQQARSSVKKDRAARLPAVNASASVTDDETLLNPRSFGSPRSLQRVEQRQYNLTADFSYELDLWGKLAAKEKGARHRLEASRWAYDFVYQTVVTDVALHYFSLRTLQEELAFLQRTQGIWQETISLNETRIEAGLDSHTDLSRARLELALVEAAMERTRLDLATEENAIAMLLGKPPSSLNILPGKLPTVIPAVPAILPSEVLQRRPDIQQKLSLVAAGRSDVEAALRNYFPSFSLTGSLGLSSPVLSHLFEWQARYWGYALSALQPLFDGGKRHADVLQAKALFAESFANYQKTVNQSFQDVEDALAGVHYSTLEHAAQKRAVDAAIDTESLTKEQWNKGMISYLLAADSERTSIQVQRQAIRLKGQQLQAWVRLMKALGVQRD